MTSIDLNDIDFKKVYRLRQYPPDEFFTLVKYERIITPFEDVRMAQVRSTDERAHLVFKIPVENLLPVEQQAA